MQCLQLKNIYKEFQRGKVKALNGVNLQIGQGSLLGLIGTNGAGKTTLIHILAGLKKQDRGEVFLFGKKIKSDSYTHRQQMGFVLDLPLYFEKLTCKEFLKFTGEMYGIPKTELDMKIEELLHFFDLLDLSDRFIETYSKGMKQRVSIAASIIHKPKFLLLDEPLDGIDPGSSEAIKSILLRMVEKGTTILITSHELDMIEALCTECAIMHKGEIVIQSRMDELENAVKKIDNKATIQSLKEAFMQVTLSDHSRKTLSWL